MATAKYTALAEITLSGTDSAVTFASIPATYRDLFLVVSGGVGTSGTTSVEIQFNGDTSTSNYPMVWMEGTSGGAASSTATRTFAVLDGSGSNFTLEVMDYAQTDKHKTMLIRSNALGADVRAHAGRWANTAAITSLTITDAGGQTLTSGSTFCLYGVK